MTKNKLIEFIVLSGAQGIQGVQGIPGNSKFLGSSLNIINETAILPSYTGNVFINNLQSNLYQYNDLVDLNTSQIIIPENGKGRYQIDCNFLLFLPCDMSSVKFSIRITGSLGIIDSQSIIVMCTKSTFIKETLSTTVELNPGDIAEIIIPEKGIAGVIILQGTNLVVSQISS